MSGMEKADPTCLHCGQTKATVKANGWYCATVDAYGECMDDWPKHRWADWPATALNQLGVNPEHHHIYRRTPVQDLQFIDCAHTDREHVFNTTGDNMLPPGYVCLRCWADTREATS